MARRLAHLLVLQQVLGVYVENAGRKLNELVKREIQMTQLDTHLGEGEPRIPPELEAESAFGGSSIMSTSPASSAATPHEAT